MQPGMQPGMMQPGMMQPGMQPGMMQPGMMMMMPKMVLPTGPPLEMLLATKHVIVKQQVEMMEMMTGFETANKYKIKNEFGQDMMFAAEMSDCCQRQCCGPNRAFELVINDMANNLVLKVTRPFSCMPSLCNCCCMPTMQVQNGQTGVQIGDIRMSWSACGANNWFPNEFTLYDAVGAPFCTCHSPCCEPWTFNIMQNEQIVGQISKKFSGLAKELFTDADNFGCAFPPTANAEQRAVVLALVFLLDFCYFEDNNNNNSNNF